LPRAEALCRLDCRCQEMIEVPFFEEFFDHEPQDAPLWTKAITTVIIRNDLSEAWTSHQTNQAGRGISHMVRCWTGVHIEPISSSGRLSSSVVLQDGDGFDEVAGLAGAASEFP
jgi:hypothetical protein